MGNALSCFGIRYQKRRDSTLRVEKIQYVNQEDTELRHTAVTTGAKNCTFDSEGTSRKVRCRELQTSASTTDSGFSSACSENLKLSCFGSIELDNPALRRSSSSDLELWRAAAVTSSAPQQRRWTYKEVRQVLEAVAEDLIRESSVDSFGIPVGEAHILVRTYSGMTKARRGSHDNATAQIAVESILKDKQMTDRFSMFAFVETREKSTLQLESGDDVIHPGCQVCTGKTTSTVGGIVKDSYGRNYGLTSSHGRGVHPTGDIPFTFDQCSKPDQQRFKVPRHWARCTDPQLEDTVDILAVDLTDFEQGDYRINTPVRTHLNRPVYFALPDNDEQRHDVRGLFVRKSGAATGVTDGEIIETNHWRDGVRNVIITRGRCLNPKQLFTAKGDSGAILAAQEVSTRRGHSVCMAVSMHFASIKDFVTKGGEKVKRVSVSFPLRLGVELLEREMKTTLICPLPSDPEPIQPSPRALSPPQAQVSRSIAGADVELRHFRRDSSSGQLSPEARLSDYVPPSSAIATKKKTVEHLPSLQIGDEVLMHDQVPAGHFKTKATENYFVHPVLGKVTTQGYVDSKNFPQNNTDSTSSSHPYWDVK